MKKIEQDEGVCGRGTWVVRGGLVEKVPSEQRLKGDEQ